MFLVIEQRFYRNWVEVTLVFDAQLFIIVACSLAGGVCANDFIIVMGEAWLYPTLCMDDVVERVAQHGSADVLGIGCIVITVALDLYLGIEVLELQIEEVAPIAAVAGLVLVTSEDAALSGCGSHVVDDFAYRIILAENGGACQILQFEGSGFFGMAFALGTLTSLVVKRWVFPLWRAATSSASDWVGGPYICATLIA